MLIQQAYVLKTPKIVGVCFGHQAIAKALGGSVAQNPSKKFVCYNEEIVIKDSQSDSVFYIRLLKISLKPSHYVYYSPMESVLSSYQKMPKVLEVLLAVIMKWSCIVKILLVFNHILIS